MQKEQGIFSITKKYYTKKNVDKIFDEIVESSNVEFRFWRSQIKLSIFSKKMLTELLVYILPKIGATYNQKVVNSLADFCLNSASGKKFLQLGDGVVVKSVKIGSDYELSFKRVC
jgi:hypothetical protein